MAVYLLSYEAETIEIEDGVAIFRDEKGDIVAYSSGFHALYPLTDDEDDEEGLAPPVEDATA